MFWLIELDKHVESTRFLSYCHYCNNLDELGWISSFFEKLVGLALIMIIFWQCVCMQSRTLTSRLSDCGTTPLADLNIWFCSACQFFAYLTASSCIFLKILRKGYIKVLTVRLLSWDHNMFSAFLQSRCGFVWYHVSWCVRVVSDCSVQSEVVSDCKVR